MENDYSEGQFVPGKGIALPTGGFRQPTTSELKKLFPTADPDIFKLADAGLFNKTTAPNSNLASNTVDGIPFRNDEQATMSGYYGEEAANNLYKQQSPVLKNPPLTAAQAKTLVAEYGLAGTNLDRQLAGLTRSEAEKKANQLKQERMGQTSSMTSFAFDPKSVSGFRDTFKDLKFKIDANKNEPWTDKKTKQQQSEAILNSYTKQLASYFNTPQEFQNALQDEEFKKVLKDYERLGGSRNTIASNIGQIQEPQTEQEAQSLGYQSIDQYLGAMNTKSKQMAIESLIPEKTIAQDQIAFEQAIPEQYKQYYFGDENTIGLLQRQQSQAEESIKLLERQAKNEERSAKAQIDLINKQNDFELQKTEAQIEENRLTARNYLVGQLAKLGALKTSGKAPEAVANLEFKYQKQAQELRTTYQFEKQDLKNKLRDKVDEIELNRDTEILKVKQDLTKGEEDVWKEIFKLQIDAQREEFKIVDNFARDFRSRNDKYTSELKKEAEKYAKDLEKAASNYNVKMTFEQFIAEKENDLQRTILPENYSRYRNEYQNVVKDRKAQASSGVPSDLLPTTETEVQDALTDAADMISQRVAAGEDRDAVFQDIKRTFLEYYPEYSSDFNTYVGVKKGIDAEEE